MNMPSNAANLSPIRYMIGCALVAFGTAAPAQDYPTKPIRLLVPFTPGGSQDVAARLISAPVAQALGQNIVIDNRAGSGGMIAAQETARAAADGYTLFMASGAQMGISPALHAKVGYDPVKSFVHVIHLTDTPMCLIAHPQLPVAGAKDLVAYANANRGKVNTASTGIGTYTHLTLELFKQITGADLTHIPYKGAAPAINDLLGRQIQTMFTSTASAQPYTSGGRLKGLGVAAVKRSRAMPEVATFKEQGLVGLEVSSWVGISVPAGVRAAVVNRLAKEYGAALKLPDVREKLERLGADVAGDSGESFARMVRADVERWAKVVRTAGIKPE
jgi:tripartite-type tricarboxylate transporter receptor subunit TctC